LIESVEEMISFNRRISNSLASDFVNLASSMTLSLLSFAEAVVSVHVVAVIDIAINTPTIQKKAGFQSSRTVTVVSLGVFVYDEVDLTSSSTVVGCLSGSLPMKRIEIRASSSALIPSTNSITESLNRYGSNSMRSSFKNASNLN
jgi:hypothetical protein